MKTINLSQRELRNQLTLSSCLKDIKLYDFSIAIYNRVSELVEIFNENALLPGIILKSYSRFYGMISRRQFFECMSRQYSQELYKNRSIEYLYNDNHFSNYLTFTSEMSISDATFHSLQRVGDLIYEPVVVVFPDGNHKLLDIHHLLLAQSQIHMLTVESLKEANEFKSEILSIAAHDLKNPLNSIMGFSRMIKEESECSVTIKDMSQIIYNSSQKMLELIVKLLDSTAIELGKIELRIGPVNIQQLVTDIIDNNSKQAESKGQILNYSFNLNKYVLNLDAVRIQEAMDNLVSNAIKYSPFNKQIEIRLEQVEEKIRFLVSDEGPGLTDDDKQKIFGKFQRLSARPTNGESSNGLGLYIVKQTIQLHKGNIWVESEPGKGSSFIFEIPVN